MKFKIVVPTYNTESWIQRCIVSILNQTFKDFECVIINDASTDKTKDRIEEIRPYLDERFRIVHNETNVKALQNIVGLSVGSFILIVHHFYLPQHIHIGKSRPYLKQGVRPVIPTFNS